MSLPVCCSLKRLFVRLLVPVEAACRCSKQYTTQLCEVGKFEEPRDETNIYHTGQLFLHKVFCYRGVILYPWMARVFDRDKATKTEIKGPVSVQNTSGREVKAKKHPYYEVLMDTTDSGHILASAESVTFFEENGHRRDLFSIKGLDYVAHEDIVPYTSTETTTPIVHDLFDKFLMPDPHHKNSPAFIAKETFTDWQTKNYPWLRLSDVYKETTNKVRVTVIPFYIGCQRTDLEQSYWWRYLVRLENFGDQAVTVTDKHLSVFSSSGSLDRLRVTSLIEQIPVLSRESPAWQYSSLVALQAPSGQIWGTFTMLKADGSKFDCIIPPFAMERSPEDKFGPNDNEIG